MSLAGWCYWPTLAASWYAGMLSWLPMLTIFVPSALALGLLFWGARFLRPLCVLAGLLGGGLVGLVVTALLLPREVHYAWLLMGMLIGATAASVVSYFMFRLILGFLLGLLLAFITPLVGLTFHDNLPPLAMNAGDTSELLQSNPFSYASGAQARDFVVDRVDEQLGLLGEWWNDLPRRTQLVMLGSASTGMMAGVLLGLVAKHLSGAFLTSCLAALILVFAINVGVPMLEPGWMRYLPSAPLGILLMLGLITALGVILQCTIFRKKADKTA